MAVTRLSNGWMLGVNYHIEEVEDGYECDCASKIVTGGYPTVADACAAAMDAINAKTDEKILSGFVWREKNVWLSGENQFNFKAAYDLAAMSQGATLPVTFKLGEAADGTPVYHEFTDMAEFTDFFTRAIAYINQCLVEGWAEKDAVRAEIEEGLGDEGAGES